MKKAKKSRVESVGVSLIQGFRDTYFLTVPYDKKDRVIPSSVECAFSALYYSEGEARQMLRAL
jgi:hypothetical protein